MYYCRCQIMCKYFGNISQLETRLGRSLIWLVVLTVDLASQPIRHTSLEVPVDQKKNFTYHLSGVVVDPLGIHFLPSSAHIWLAIWPLYHRLSKKAGCLIYLGVRNEHPVGPQQPQIRVVSKVPFFGQLMCAEASNWFMFPKTIKLPKHLHMIWHLVFFEMKKEALISLVKTFF